MGSYSKLTASSDTNSTLTESSFYHETSVSEDENISSARTSETNQSTFLSQMNSTSSTDMNSTITARDNLTFRPSVNSTPAVGLNKAAGPTLKKGKKKRHPCEICDKECNYPGYLGQHYCDQHFSEELKQEVAKKFDGKKCKDCAKTINSALDQTRHVGMKHGMVNTLLEKRGLKSVGFKFYKYNNPALKLAAMKQVALAATNNMFVDETIPEESSESSNISKSNETSSMMDTTETDTEAY